MRGFLPNEKKIEIFWVEKLIITKDRKANIKFQIK